MHTAARCCAGPPSGEALAAVAATAVPRCGRLGAVAVHGHLLAVSDGSGTVVGRRMDEGDLCPVCKQQTNWHSTSKMLHWSCLLPPFLHATDLKLGPHSHTRLSWPIRQDQVKRKGQFPFKKCNRVLPHITLHRLHGWSCGAMCSSCFKASRTFSCFS